MFFGHGFPPLPHPVFKMSEYITRPSSLPAKRLSPKWESAGSSQQADQGNKRHEAMASVLLKGDELLVNQLPQDHKEAVLWAADFIKSTARVESNDEVIVEELIEIKRGGQTVMVGTPDAVLPCGVFFDLKWRKFDYSAQMAAYALGIMQKYGHEAVTCYVLYGDGMFYERIDFALNEAKSIVYGILDRVETSAECAVSQYCDWCKHKLECKTLANSVSVVQRDDLLLVSPEDVSKALEIADAAVTWADAVKAKAKELATDGMQIPGWRLKEKAGAREVDPAKVAEVFMATGLSSEAFLSACKVKIGELEKSFAESNGLKTKEAKAELGNRIKEFLVSKPTTKYLERE